MEDEINEPSAIDFDLEERRIKEVYSRRDGAFRYSLFNQAQLFRIQSLERKILAVLRARSFSLLQDKKILEIGCGTGQWLRKFIQWGACPDHMVGIDVLPYRASEAKRLCPVGVQVHCGNAAKLPLSDASVDLVSQFTVFSSIPDSTIKQMLAREMLRVLKQDGLILWYDFFFNNPSNPDVRGIRKPEITRLFPYCCIEFHRVSLAPPLSRLLAPHTWLGCHVLERMRLLNTHYLAVIQRK